MKTSRKSKMLAGAFMAVFTLASPMAYGQATRTWVSGVGDDVNPCSRTAPGKTFAGAISKTAAGGEIDVLDPGGFGTVTIIKSMTIDGQGTMASILAAGTNGIIINAGPTDVVTLRNLSINGFGTGINGIRILGAAEVNIENCVIFEFTGHGVEIAPSLACRVNIRNTVVRGCSGGAVQSTPTAAGTVVTITDSSLTHSLFGFRADDRTAASLTNTVTSNNVNNGVVASAATAASRVYLNDCVICDNGFFGVASSAALSTVLISNNTIAQNGTGVGALSGGSLISFGNNRINGNTTNGVPTSTIGQQ